MQYTFMQTVNKSKIENGIRPELKLLKQILHRRPMCAKYSDKRIV